MKNNIVANNEILQSIYPDITSSVNPSVCKSEPQKPYELEPFWHVYAIDGKFEKVGKKIVTRFKVRVGYRCSATKAIKTIERRLIHQNHVVYLESLDDLYYYDLSALRFKSRDIARLTRFFSYINVDVKNYLENMYY